jgi:two-component system chemotaxis response regulator CheB
MGPAIRTLVADGSVTERARLIALLRSDPEIEVVGEASRGAETVAMTKRLRPTVIAMGAQLPQDGGFEATKEIMIEMPTPIVIISDETDARQVEVSILALRAGALAVVSRPPAANGSKPDLADQRLVSTVKAMSQVKVVRRWRTRPETPPQRPVAASDVPARVIAMAASTGGPAALERILSELPPDFRPPILIVQHIASGFIDGLVNWLNAVSSLKVKVAANGESLLPHTVYVAPDGNHLGVSSRSKVLLSQAEPIGGFRPSATFLFESVAKAFGGSAVHVILTGMGEDGVAGLEVAHKLKGTVLAQDEASSVVSGMPNAAINARVVDRVVPLTSIAHELIAATDMSRISHDTNTYC